MIKKSIVNEARKKRDGQSRRRKVERIVLDTRYVLALGWKELSVRQSISFFETYVQITLSVTFRDNFHHSSFFVHYFHIYWIRKQVSKQELTSKQLT